MEAIDDMIVSFRNASLFKQCEK